LRCLAADIDGFLDLLRIGGRRCCRLRRRGGLSDISPRFRRPIEAITGTRNSNLTRSRSRKFQKSLNPLIAICLLHLEQRPADLGRSVSTMVLRG
jgi:hypothetical protein